MASPTASTLPPYDPGQDSEYTPSPYVLATSRVGASDLVYCFNDFCASLNYAHTNPQHAFERLVINLSSALLHSECMEKEEAQKINQLQLSNDSLRAQLAEARLALESQTRTTVPAAQTNTEKPIIDQLASRRVGAETNKPEINYPAIGTYHTKEAEPFPWKQTIVKKEVSFTRKYDIQPVFPKGFTSLHFAIGSMIEVYAYNSDFQSDCCAVKLEAPNCRLTGTGCAWLELDSKDPNFQCGEPSAMKLDWRKCGTGEFVAFPRPYLQPPRIVVWFKKLRLKATNNWRLCTYPSNITTTGFMFQINGLQDEADISGIWWVAYPADLPGVCSGTVESAYPFPTQDKRVEFGSGVFTTPPRVIIVINTIELDCTQDVVVSISVSDFSATGMTWRVDGLPDNTPHRIGASYIALR